MRRSASMSYTGGLFSLAAHSYDFNVLHLGSFIIYIFSFRWHVAYTTKIAYGRSYIIYLLLICKEHTPIQHTIWIASHSVSNNIYGPMIYKHNFVWRRHDNMLPCTGSRVNANHERIASWGEWQCRAGDPRIIETPLADHCSQRLNHSATIRPSKTDWHQLSGITHWLQQLVNSGY